MNFKFLHASDLHLGSPLLGLAMKDEQVARQFAAASRNAFTSLVTQAIEQDVAFVVIAGDVYDGEWKDTSIGLFFNRELARLDRAGIAVYLLKGNHDAESVVTKAITLPERVHVFPANKPATFRIEDLKVALHGRSFPEREVNDNYAAVYPEAVPGWLNIGVLHTSCDGRPGHAAYAPCTLDDLKRRGYDYWALGHVHEYEILSQDPWVVFPGNLQGRNVRECGPKGAVIVDVADGHVTGVERLVVDHARWATVEIDLSDHGDEASAIRAIEAAMRPVAEEAQGRLVALRVRLTGRSALHRHIAADAHRFFDEVQAAAQRCHEDIWLERVRNDTTDDVQALVRTGDDDALAAIDLAGVLDSLQQDPEFRVLANDVMTKIFDKIPGGVVGEDNDIRRELDTLLAEARALVLSRADA